MVSFTGNHSNTKVTTLADVPRCRYACYTISNDHHVFHAAQYTELSELRIVFCKTISLITATKYLQQALQGEELLLEKALLVVPLPAYRFLLYFYTGCSICCHGNAIAP